VNWLIPLSDIDFGPAETAAVLNVLESRWLTMGGVTQAFESEFSAYVGAKHSLAVTNCTAALHMACLAIGLLPGDEVILPALTFVATANAVRYTGATPVFADVTSEQNLNISPESIEQCITPRTRAIIVVHYGGYPCDMPRIMEIAKKHKLYVIEDDAHAIGSDLDGTRLGNWGDIGCFSFFSNKNMTTGEGGMITTNDDSFAEKLRLFRSHGMTSMTWDRHKGHAWSYDVVELGYNNRIDEIRAALGRVQLGKLDANNDRRRYLVQQYRDALQELTPEIIVPFENHPGLSAAHIMPVLLPAGTDRIRFMENMKAHGIQTSIHYPPIHHFTAYQKFKNSILPVTEDVAEREVTLPLYPALRDADVVLVAKAVQEAEVALPTANVSRTLD
jgi:dTDP-4-amino-4,6-dideoxygalactose transaminase